MASVFKRSADKRDRSKHYYIAYTTEAGRRRVVAGCTDRAASEEIARKLETDTKLRQRGIIDPSKERIAEQSRRSIREHIEEFLCYIQTRKADAHADRYLIQVRGRLQAFCDFSQVVSLGEMNSDRVAAFLTHLQQRGLSGVTVNEYIGTLKAFTRWCVTTSRVNGDPLAPMKKREAAQIEKKRPRRSLTADEIGALLHATQERPVRELQTIRTGPNIGQLTAHVRPAVLERAERIGKERALAYLLALWTGLRRSELRALQWQDVRLDTLPARIELRAKTTKSRRADSVALHPQVVEALRLHRPADAKPTDPVLSHVPGMKVLKADLRLAGVDETNGSGRVDLHSMRKSLATYLSANAVPLRLAQAHLRHTDPRLTATVYTDERVLPVAAAIASLPWLPTEPVQEADVIRMTGTFDEGAAQRAAPAQRARHTDEHPDARTCSESESGGQWGASSQPLEFAEGCAAKHDNSTKRVMGLEPTTFTLAT